MGSEWSSVEPTEPGLYWLEVDPARCKWVDNLFVVHIDDKLRVELVANRDRRRQGTIGYVGKGHDYFCGARWCRLDPPIDPPICSGNGLGKCKTAPDDLRPNVPPRMMA